MIPNPTSGFPPEPVRQYMIRVKGRLNTPDWAEWFGGMNLEFDEERGETIMQGPVADQAELFGLLTRLRNLGMTLLLVECVRAA